MEETGNIEETKNITLQNQQNDSDVEEEDLYGDEGAGPITKPFNPNEIDVDISTVNLGSLIDQLYNKEIDLQPDFQRATDIWDNEKKSRLIESILLGLPLPSFYFSEDPVSLKLSVIDGLQRICAIRDFVLEKNNPLRLCGLQFLRSYEGKTYKDLDRSEVRRIISLKIVMNTLRKNTPNDVKYIIFQRVNTAGVPLMPQEMRHALNQGPAAIFMKELSELKSFKQATNYKIKSKRMQDREFVNRFVAFYIGDNDYNGDLETFLNDKMGEINRMTHSEREDIRIAFDKSMKTCYAIFGHETFRKCHNENSRRNPISKAVYDTLSVNVARLDDGGREILVRKSEEFKRGFGDLFNNDRFNSSVSVATGQKQKVVCRFSIVKELIDKIIKQ